MTLYPIATARQEKILLAAVWETDREGEGGVGGGREKAAAASGGSDRGLKCGILEVGLQAGLAGFAESGCGGSCVKKESRVMPRAGAQQLEGRTRFGRLKLGRVTDGW